MTQHTIYALQFYNSNGLDLSVDDLHLLSDGDFDTHDRDVR